MKRFIPFPAEPPVSPATAALDEALKMNNSANAPIGHKLQVTNASNRNTIEIKSFMQCIFLHPP